MPEEIRRQLQSLGLRRGSDIQPHVQPRPAAASDLGLEGHWTETEAGPCYVVEQAYPPDHRHGHFRLGAFLEESLEPWAPLATVEEAGALSPSTLVFLDIETTGLSDGAGTYAFLIGLGRFEGDLFHLYQIFLPSPAEERALLQATADLLKDTGGLVTFNGRGFDLPILATRFTMARMPLPWHGKVHLDLLPVSRRLWRPRLTRCALSCLEEHLLGIERDILDVPGWRIPSLYHDYLRRWDPEVLRPVFYHNAQDILSMVTLAVRIARFLRDPFGDSGARHGLEFYALGRLYEQRGETSAAVDAYRAALLLALPEKARERAWERLSRLLKRAGAWEEAVEVWEALVTRPGSHPLYAYVELSRYYEHRCQDLARAEAIVRRAIAEHGEKLPADDLGRRLKRLRHKQGDPKE